MKTLQSKMQRGFTGGSASSNAALIYTETLAEDFLPYFCLYERCLYMHNLVLEKAEELENDYKESVSRYKSKLKVKKA